MAHSDTAPSTHLRCVRPALLAAATIMLGSCRSTPEPGVARLPGTTPQYRHLDATFAFTLPDTGGYIVNTVPIPEHDIPSQLEALFKERPAELRAIVVWDNPLRRGDAQRLAAMAEAAGGRAFDAELSGWPMRFDTTPAPNQN
jgi:hypothetical protein